MRHRADGRHPRIRDVVEWHVTRTPPEISLAARLANLVGFAVAVALQDSSGGLGGFDSRDVPDPRLPVRTDQLIELAPPTITGTAPWLQTWRWGDQRVVADRGHAWLESGPGARTRPLPLDELVVRSARCRSWYRRRPRRADAVWELDLVGPDTGVRITGPWLSLAWLGHLGGWPEPPVRRRRRRRGRR